MYQRHMNVLQLVNTVLDLDVRHHNRLHQIRTVLKPEFERKFTDHVYMKLLRIEGMLSTPEHYIATANDWHVKK